MINARWQDVIALDDAFNGELSKLISKTSVEQLLAIYNDAAADLEKITTGLSDEVDALMLWEDNTIPKDTVYTVLAKLTHILNDSVYTLNSMRKMIISHKDKWMASEVAIERIGEIEASLEKASKTQLKKWENARNHYNEAVRAFSGYKCVMDRFIADRGLSLSLDKDVADRVNLQAKTIVNAVELIENINEGTKDSKVSSALSVLDNLAQRLEDVGENQTLITDIRKLISKHTDISDVKYDV